MKMKKFNKLMLQNHYKSQQFYLTLIFILHNDIKLFQRVIFKLYFETYLTSPYFYLFLL